MFFSQFNTIQIIVLIVASVIIILTAVFYKWLNEKAMKITGKLFNVNIVPGYSSMWKVEERRFLKRIFIELLQLLWILIYFAIVMGIIALIFVFK